MEFLSRIAAVIVALLLYGVIAMLNMPKVARAADGVTMAAAHNPVSCHAPMASSVAHHSVTSSHTKIQ